MFASTDHPGTPFLAGAVGSVVALVIAHVYVVEHVFVGSSVAPTKHVSVKAKRSTGVDML